MTRITRALASLVVLAAIATTTACDGDANSTPTQTTSASPTTSSAAPSESPTQLSQAEQEIEDAKNTVSAFEATLDRLRQDPKLPISDLLLKVSRGSSYQTWAQQTQIQRGRRYRQIGNTRLESLQGRAVKPVEGRSAVQVDVCYDVSKVNMVDKDGKSLVSPDRVPRGRATYIVSKYSDGWFVVKDSAKGVPC